MEIREVTNKEVWEKFFEGVEEKTFLQSWAWGEFHKSMGGKVWRMGVFEAGGLVGAALVVKVSAKRGTFLLVQHGPALASQEIPNSKFQIPNKFQNSKFQILKFFLEELKRIGKQEGASFIRMAPLLERTGENERMMRELGFREAAMHANAYEATWKLDITPSEGDFLKHMRKTTRYLIRQAERNGYITVEQSNRLEDVARYERLNREVARRQQFVPFSKEFTKREFDIFSQENQALWFFGSYKGELVAAALVIFWSGVGFYHQAASSSKYAKLSIPYVVQWEAIQEAKKRGCTMYDFWGYVDPKTYPKHPWAGPTLFKMGFGGKVYRYVKTQDYPLSWRYWPIAAFETVRKWRRGL